jgi:predicted secreted Zn-dependent protease
MRRSLWTCLSLAVLLPICSADADVRENIKFEEYAAVAERNASLRSTLNRASTIRQSSVTYHAFTDWNVRWDMRWHEERDGRCRVTEATATLDATIKLPKLVGGTPEARRDFERYLEALRTHELGHLEIGKRAAQQTQRAIARLPQSASCANLERAAAKLARDTLKRSVSEERQYDVSTQYGRTQGASLNE